MNLREEIIRKRKELGLSQSKLAEKCNVSLSMIYMLEKGNEPIQLTNCRVKVLNFLEVPWKEHINRGDEKLSIGKLFLISRLDLDIPIKKLSYMTGVSVDTIRNIEKERVEPSERILKILMEALNCKAETKYDYKTSNTYIRLQGAVKKLRIPFKTLADEAGIHEKTLYKIVQGKTKPRMETIKKLEKALGIELVEYDMLDKLQRALRELNMTSRTLADKANVSYSTVCKILQGKSNPRMKTIRKLEEGLEIKLLIEGIAEKVQKALQELEMEPRVLARKANVSYSTVCRILKGETKPRMETIRKLEEGLEIKLLMEGIAEKVQKALQELEMEPRVLARKANVSYNTIYNILQGKSNPRIKTIRKLEKVLGIKLVTKEIAEKVQKALQELEMEPKILAKKANLDYNTIYVILQGKENIEVRTIEQLQEVLKINLVFYDIPEKLPIVSPKNSRILQMLSDKVNVSYKTLYKIVQGKTNPRIETIKKLEKALGIELVEYNMLDKLQRALRELNMTSRTLADKVNVSYSTVNKILQGKDNIRVKTIKKLEKVLGVKLISDNIYEKLKIALQYSK